MKVGTYNTAYYHSFEASKHQHDLHVEADVYKNKKNNDPTHLSEDEKRVLRKLQIRDAEVRAHETAHKAVGGGMTGAASFTYQQGPDGKMYAIGGEVPITVEKGSTPQETIAKARQAIAAAMAPSDPSGADLAVASSAKIMEAKARQQLIKEEQEKLQGQETYKNLQQLSIA